jgi:hypothetical protein
MKSLIAAGLFLLAGYAIHELSQNRPQPGDQPDAAVTREQLERAQRELNATSERLARARIQLDAMAQPTPAPMARATPAATPFPLARQVAAATPPAWFVQRLNDESASLSGPASDTPHIPGAGRRH